MAKLRDITRYEIKPDGPDCRFINLQNGVYDIQEKNILPHDPKNESWRFFSKIPIHYDPEATCPVIDAFIAEMIKPDDIPLIEEWFGFCLYRKYFIKKAMIFAGKANTGKTTLIRLLSSFLGKGNFSGVSMQRMGSSDKFSVGKFVNKYANICDELSAKDIENNDAFKQVTGGSPLEGEKKFGEPFPFVNYAKLIFACNEIPTVKDMDDMAYFSRWIVVEFTRAKDKEEERDKFLSEKMTTPQELSGFLNKALRGLERLLTEKGTFSYGKTAEETKKHMMKMGSSIAQFVESRLSFASGSWMSKEQMYDAYNTYCGANGFPVETKDKLGKTLPGYATYITNSRGIDPFKTKGQVEGWRNVELVSELIIEQSTLIPLDDEIIPDKIIT